jgi:DNA-binding MarR family transcriptional regulator
MKEAHPERVQRTLQDLRIELGILTSRVSLAAGLRPTDLDILDIVVHEGPISPTRLAQRTGVHPATMTGVLARLERDGWIARSKSAVDGRAAVIEAVPDRADRLGRL